MQAGSGQGLGWGARLAWPQQCELCRRWCRRALCPACLQRFTAPRPRCRRCALPLPAAASPCADCLRQPPPYGSCIAAGDYGFPWDRLITRFKFDGDVELAAALALALEQAVRQTGPPAAELLLPVPLSRERLAERGYNQAWELARRLGRSLGLPAHAERLLRLRDTGHQVGLDRARRAANLRDAFWVEPRQAPGLAGRRIALIDDVMTTGATAAAASRALLAAGAAAVEVWVVARTPSPQAG